MIHETSPRRPVFRAAAVAVAATVVLGAITMIPLMAGCWGGRDMNGRDNGKTAGDGGATNMEVRLQWHGHAAFLITSPGGVRVLTDPYPATIGYGNRQFKADLVTVSHEHFDHNSVDSVQGNPEVLRGLSGGDWAMAEKTLGDVTVVSLRGTYHDNQEGASGRGKNALFLIETGGLRILHLGDLGHVPSADVVERVGRVDIVLVPVGGVFTVDGETAGEIVDLFQACIAVPMHFKTEAISDWQIADAEPFLETRPIVRRLELSEVTLSAADLPESPEAWLLDYSTTD